MNAKGIGDKDGGGVVGADQVGNDCLIVDAHKSVG